MTEATQFPYGRFDDQMDALSQYLNWIAEHPNPHKRLPMATAQGVTSQGRVMHSSGHGGRACRSRVGCFDPVAA
jgi:hypothetical protein